MFKNVAGQRWVVFAYEDGGGTTPGAPKTGDAANITAKIAKDGAAAGATDDTNPTEIEDGYYAFDLTQAETNADELLLLPESSTANIQVVGVPGVVYTRPPNFGALGIESDGDLTKVNTLDGHTAQTADHAAAIASLVAAVITNAAGADVAADIIAAKAVVDAILVDTDVTIPALIAALNDLTAAEVNAEVVDALATDAYAELAAVPAANAPLADKINWLFAVARNKITNDGTTMVVRNDADSADVASAAIADAAGTLTRDKFTT